eukprot:933986-Rhodomonas_salina.1
MRERKVGWRKEIRITQAGKNDGRRPSALAAATSKRALAHAVGRHAGLRPSFLPAWAILISALAGDTSNHALAHAGER